VLHVTPHLSLSASGRHSKLLARGPARRKGEPRALEQYRGERTGLLLPVRHWRERRTSAGSRDLPDGACRPMVPCPRVCVHLVISSELAPMERFQATEYCLATALITFWQRFQRSEWASEKRGIGPGWGEVVTSNLVTKFFVNSQHFYRGVVTNMSRV
jgi:hypothetical protein